MNVLVIWICYSIYENKDEYEMVLEGKLVCNSAGTMDDPWKLYDITVLF